MNFEAKLWQAADKMLFLYLDESGDLGFDFDNKRPSSFFVVCIFRKYEAKDTVWYEIFKDKIKYENLAAL